MSQNNNRDNILKTVGIITLAIVVIAFLYNFLVGGQRGFSLNYSSGYGYNSLIAFVLVIAVKLLWLTFIISLVVGIIMFIKKTVNGKKINLRINNSAKDGYACPCCGTKLTADFKFCPNCKASLKEKCVKCGKDLQVGWNCCPACGTARKPTTI